MSLINKSNIKRIAKPLNKWPNPYKIKKDELKYEAKDMPVEIVTLILAYGRNFKGESYTLSILETFGLKCAFPWSRTSEGTSFWHEINDGKYTIFYKTYRPRTLEKKIEELERGLIP